MRSLLLVLLFALSFSTQSIEATNKVEPAVVTSEINNYLMTTGVANYIPVMIMTAAEMKKEEGKQFGEFEVVIYGAAVKLFTDKAEGEKLIAMAKEAGVKIVLCDFALKHLGISQDELPDGLIFVHNAFKYALNKKTEGFTVLSV